jgi:hypothetical protein
MALRALFMLALRGTLVAGVLSLAACAGAPQYRLNDGTVYPFGPNKAVVHRLSRLQSEGDGVVRGAVVFIEFRDLDEETCRGVGDLEVALVVSGREPQSKRLNLDSTSENNARWNRALRMYEVLFTIDPPLIGGKLPAVRVDLRWTCGTKPAVMDSAQLDALPAQ